MVARRGRRWNCASLAVQVSEDRTFKVWDLSAGSCIFQSHIISASPCTALAIDPLDLRCAIFTSDRADSGLRRSVRNAAAR